MVVAPEREPVIDVIEAEAARLGAPVFLANRDWIAHAEHGRLVYQDEDGLLDLPAPRLVGRHQFTNAGVAIAALRQVEPAIATEAIEAGLANVEWPARMQRLTTGRLVARARGDAEIWLDGGHNPAAGQVIAEAVADLEERVPRPLFMICGMLNTKDPVGFFQPFAGLARKAYTVPVPSSTAGRDPAELAEAARSAGVEARAGCRCRDRARRDRGGNRPADSAAHPDLRLALSRRLGARRQRHPARLARHEKAGTVSGPGSFKKRDEQAGRYMPALIQSDSRPFGTAPTCIEVGSPFLNMISVGIERTP